MQARKTSSRIRKNDLVMVITGRDRGKTGKVMRVVPESGRVLLERLNVVKRHSRPRGAASPGGIVEKEAPIADLERDAVLRSVQRAGPDRNQSRSRRRQHQDLPALRRIGG